MADFDLDEFDREFDQAFKDLDIPAQKLSFDEEFDAALDAEMAREFDELGIATQGDYNPLRAGVVDFVESATGYGTEVDALFRRLSGDADTFGEAHKQSLAAVAQYEADNKWANRLSTGAGFAAGFLIPSLAFAKVGKVADAAAKSAAIGRAIGLGAVEGAVYGFGQGDELDERATSAAIGATIGGVASGALGKFVIKSDEELAAAAAEAAKRKGKGSWLGGEEGFQDVSAAATPSTGRKATDSSMSSKEITLIDPDAEDLSFGQKAWGSIRSLGRSMSKWNEAHVSKRFARLADDAEEMQRRGRAAVDQDLAGHPAFQQANDQVAKSPVLKEMLLRINPEMDKSQRLTWDQAINSPLLDDADRLALKTFRKAVSEAQQSDIFNMRIKDGAVELSDKIDDYMPSVALSKIDTKVKDGVNKKAARPDHYADPVEAMRQYMYDLNDSREMIQRFFGDMAEAGDFSYMDDILKYLKQERTTSRTEAVIKAIRDRAKKEGATDAVQANIINGLTSQFVAARAGGNSIGSIMRRSTSIALLANPGNAMLNTVEGVTAPLYQNGVLAWLETLPEAIVSTISPKAAGKSGGWITDVAMGHGDAYMGEIAQSGQNIFKSAVDDFAIFGIGGSNKVAQGVDSLGKVAYKVTGVDKVNRMTREILSNSAVKRGQRLARKAFKADEDALAKLREHDGMRGLLDKEMDETMRALKKLDDLGDINKLNDRERGWVMNFAGASLNKWQPVSAGSMPKAFHDNPNGRMFYSMLSYMNRQMNNIIDDVGVNILKAQQEGLNTPAGQRAIKKAYANAAKYAALFGVVAGTWNTARLGLDPSKDKTFAEAFTVEGMSEATINDLASNMTSGLLNLRSNEFGKKPGSIESIIPAPLSAAGNVASGLLEATTGDFEGLAKAAQTYVPGVSNVDRLYRGATGERLLTDDGTGVGLITGKDGRVDTGMLYDLINQGR